MQRGKQRMCAQGRSDVRWALVRGRASGGLGWPGGVLGALACFAGLGDGAGPVRSESCSVQRNVQKRAIPEVTSGQRTRCDL